MKFYENEIKKGEVYLVDFGSNNLGSEQNGIRPAVIVQNDVGNKFSNTTIVVPFTSKSKKRKLPTHVELDFSYRDNISNMALCEVIRTLDKKRILSDNRLGTLSNKDMFNIEKALKISLAL